MAVTDDRPTLDGGAPQDDLATMTLFEHLAELRMRLIISFAALAVTMTISWFFYDHAISFMRGPYCSFIHHHPSKSITGLGTGCSLVTNGPLEGFTTRIKVSAYGGIALATPVLFWELWRFITPGLKANEKKYIVPFVTSAVVLFALGVSTAIVVFPKALQWLIDVGGSGVVPLFSPQKYFTLYVLMCVVFGAVFMYPVVVVGLELTGVVPSARWRRWRRPAILVICGVAAVITPSSDPFSFLALALPMILFYEGSIVLGRVLHK